MEIREVFIKLNELKGDDRKAFYIKAREFAEFLARMPQCRDIEVLDCDVCVTDFFPEFHERLREIYPLDFDKVSEKEMDRLNLAFQSQIPEMARVRVHVVINEAKLTYCFNCESTMCGNEIEYPGDADWDILHEIKVREIISQNPDWNVSKFLLNGCTRNRICIDVISTNLEFEFRQFDWDDYHVSLVNWRHSFLNECKKQYPYIELFKNI